MEEESQKQLRETPLYQPQFIVPLLLLLLLLSMGIILVLGRRITHLNGSNPSQSTPYWPSYSPSPSTTWSAATPSPSVMPSISATQATGETITLQPPYIVIRNHEGVNQEYNSLELSDVKGNRQTLDYFNLTTDSWLNTETSFIDGTLVYLKNSTHVFSFTSGQRFPTYRGDLSFALTGDEHLSVFLASPDNPDKLYLFLSADYTNFSDEQLSIRVIDLKNQTTRTILTPTTVKYADFIYNLIWLTPSVFTFQAGYGDAGFLSGTYYLFNTETNKLTELATFASDADGLISATGQTIRVHQPGSRVIIMNNLSFELKSSDRESLPKSLADFLNYQDKGSLIQYSVAGTIQKQDIDLGQFLNIGPIEDQYATLTSVIQTIFYYDGSIYLQAKKSDGATYTTPMMADGYYQWRNGVWQTLAEATYQQAYRAYYTTSPDEVNLLAGDTQAYLSYEPDLGDVLATRDLLTGKQNDLLHQTGILTLLGVMRKE